MRMNGTKLSFSAPMISTWNATLPMELIAPLVKMLSGSTVTPIGMPMIVVTTMEISSAPFTLYVRPLMLIFRQVSSSAMTRPIRPSTTLLLPKSIKLPSSPAAARPEVFRPMLAISRPTAPPMPILIFFGRLCANSSRSLKTEIKTKITPEIATMPNACPQVTSPPATIAATRFGITSTGASAIGALA